MVALSLCSGDSPLTPKNPRTSSHDFCLPIRSPGYPPRSPDTTRRNSSFPRQATSPGVPGRANQPPLLEKRKQKSPCSGELGGRRLPPSCPRLGRASIPRQTAHRGGGFPQPSGDSLGCRPREIRQRCSAGSAAHFLSRASLKTPPLLSFFPRIK